MSEEFSTYPPKLNDEDWNALLDHGLESPVDYIIRKKGSYWEAINGSTKKIDYGGANNAGGVDGSNAAAVTNKALAVCPPYGTVYAKGIITITEQITVGITKSFMFDEIIINDTDDDGIVIDAGEACSHMNLFVIGKKIRFPTNYTKSILKLRNVKDVYVNIRHIYPSSGVGAAGSVGVHLLGDGFGCYFNTLHIQTIGGCETGIKLESTPSGFCNANKIYDADIQAPQGYGMKQVNNGLNTSGNNFIGITVNGVTTGNYGFYNVDEDNVFFGCRCIDSESGAIDWYTTTLTGNARPRLYGCQKSSGSIQGSFIHFGTNHFITENSGTATITAGNTSIDVPHGLAITPDINNLAVTPKDDLAGRNFWIEPHGSAPETYFVIKMSSLDLENHSFSWKY